nr:uncharacterized protein LOC120099331 [Rattus norvegicus]
MEAHFFDQSWLKAKDFLLSLLPSFPPSLLPSFPPSLLPSFPPSLLPSFPPSLLSVEIPSVFLCSSLCSVNPIVQWVDKQGAQSSGVSPWNTTSVAGVAKKATWPRAEAAAGSANRSKLKKKVKRRSKLRKRNPSPHFCSRNIKVTRNGEPSLHPSRRTKLQRPIRTTVQEELSPSQQSRPTRAYAIQMRMDKKRNPSARAAAKAVPPCPNIATVPTPRRRVN